MPRFKGSCGCYNRQDARELGLAAAIVWNDMLDRAEHFGANPMWYDQKDAAERLGISESAMGRAVEKLVDVGRITKKRGYRPNSTITTTWVTVIAEEDGGYDGSRNPDLTVPRNPDLTVPILNETEERDLEKVAGSAGSPTDSPNDGSKDLRVVYLRVNPSGKKGAWKSQKVYSTKEEVDKLDEMGEDDYVDFKHWKSPNWVGDEDRAKFKRMKVKLVQPDVVDEDEIIKDDGKKYKVIKGGVCY